MGRLRTLTILLTLGAWGAATDGAPPDDAAPATDAAARPPAPVPPVKYLEAGARLFNSGQYDLAAEVPQRRADVSRPALGERADRARRLPARDGQGPGRRVGRRSRPRPPRPHRRPGAGIAGSGAGPGRRAPAPRRPRAVARRGADGRSTRPRRRRDRGRSPPPRATPSSRPAGCSGGPRADPRGQLRRRRGQGRPGPRAERPLGPLRRHPGQGRRGASRRPGPRPSPPRPGATSTKDRTTAKAKLKEARAAIAAKQFEQAEAIALDVKSWNLSYGMFEDNPDKVAAAARALRRRDALRNSSPREQPSQGVYDVLVQEARQLDGRRPARRGRGEGQAGPADERRPVGHRRPRRGRPPRHRDGPRPAASPKGDQAVAVASADAGRQPHAGRAPAPRPSARRTSCSPRATARPPRPKFAEAEAAPRQATA